MAKGKRVKKKAPFVDIYGVLLLVATICMSIGYAEIVGTTITVETKAEASSQEGVFITDVVCNESNSVSNNYLATTMDTSITLDSPTDTKKFTVTIYNKTVKPQVFIGVIKSDKMDEFTGAYNNTNISYSLGSNMIAHETILPAKDWITFDVDLGFNGQGTMPETLRSLLNFRFQEVPTIQISDIPAIENVYPNYTPQEITFTVSNQRQDEKQGLITNGVPLTYAIAPNVPAPLTAKIYDKDGQEVATNKAITISSENAETHTYKLKVFWNNTNDVQGIEYNSAGYAGQTLASAIKVTATPTDENNKYLGYKRIEKIEFNVTTEPLYFNVTTDKTTVEMNNTTNAEKIKLTIKNNDGAININKFPVEYKLSIDNSKFKLYVDGSELGENTITIGNTVAIPQEHEIQLISKDGVELTKEENCNISIETMNPYGKTETIALTITDTTGPTAPTITGGSTGLYTSSQTISVSEVSTDVGIGISKYQYILNSAESTETDTIIDIVNTATDISQIFNTNYDGYYVYFRAVDKAGNTGEWSKPQQLYIDINEPIVSLAKEVPSEATIEQGDSYEVVKLFTYNKNGSAGIKSVTYTVNGKTIDNIKELAEGTHTIICTVTKETNVSKTASLKILVEPASIIATDGRWSGKNNNPLLMEGMTAVYWSTDGGVTASTTQEGAEPIYSKIGGKSTGADNSNFVWKNWYRYRQGDNATDTKKSRWANAVTDDGSYWVWVPRYKYLISDKPATYGETEAGKVTIKFIPTTHKKGANGYTTAENSDGERLTTDSNGYIIHPAFENGSITGKSNGFNNGEWDSDIPGFWVAKYEMSMEDGNGNHIETSSYDIGNVKLSDTIKMVSKPNVSSWAGIQFGQIYQNCLLYDEEKNSHLMKNSEWGATAYLAHSQYGRNRNEVTRNNSSSKITGNAGDTISGTNHTEGITNAYNTTKGMLASTTGNIYGVYDMNAGANEYVSMWDVDATSNMGYGKAKDGTKYFSSDGSSDKYRTAVKSGQNTDSIEIMKTAFRTGDGLKETYISENYNWFKDRIGNGDKSSPFRTRSGCYTDYVPTGLWNVGVYSGYTSSRYSFRTVLSNSDEWIEKVTDTNPGVLEGSGTETEPYVINSIEDLVFFSYDVRQGNTYEEKYIVLGQNLDFKSNSSYVEPVRTDYAKYGYSGELKTLLTSGEGFISIGTLDGEKSTCFAGTFDAKGNIIKNLYINIISEESKQIGLFSYNRGDILNLKLLNVEITVDLPNGGLIGAINGQLSSAGSIKNCITSGNITSKTYGPKIGGITAYTGGIIEKCINLCNINAQGIHTGGILGYTNSKRSNYRLHKCR